MIVEVQSIPIQIERVTWPEQIYVTGVGRRYITLPYPITWHIAAYDAAQAARIAARRAGASPAEARIAGEAAYRRAWQTCMHCLAPAA